MDIKIDFDVSSVMAKVNSASEYATSLLCQQILEDCNKYLPNDQDGLMDSAIISSDLNNGVVSWNTIYAPYLYYGVVMVGKKPKTATTKPLNFSKDPNPNAQSHWIETAKDVHCDDWIAVYEKSLKKEMR